jgi:hypothetical protein
VSNPSRFRPRRSWTIWILAAVVVVVIALSFAGTDNSGLPYDPDSTDPSGTKGLVQLLEHFGTPVDTGSNPTGNVALLLYDDLSPDETDRLRSWVEAGGTLVIADPTSPIAGLDDEVSSVFRQPTSLSPSCRSPYVDGVERIDPARYGDYLVFDLPHGASGCFPGQGGYFMVTRSLGGGTVVTLGTPELLTNARLDKHDNSVLAVRLLSSIEGVTFLHSTAPIEAGEDRTWNVVPVPARAAIWQLAIAGLVLELWRARRVGKPVVETQPVEVPGSQLTVATGNLLQTAGDVNGAGEILRADLRRSLADLIGIDPATDAPALAAVVSDRTGVARARVLDAIESRPLANERELVEVARTIEEVHREVANAR